MSAFAIRSGNPAAQKTAPQRQSEDAHGDPILGLTPVVSMSSTSASNSTTNNTIQTSNNPRHKQWNTLQRMALSSENEQHLQTKRMEGLIQQAGGTPAVQLQHGEKSMAIPEGLTAPNHDFVFVSAGGFSYYAEFIFEKNGRIQIRMQRIDIPVDKSVHKKYSKNLKGWELKNYQSKKFFIGGTATYEYETDRWELTSGTGHSFKSEYTNLPSDAATESGQAKADMESINSQQVVDAYKKLFGAYHQAFELPAKQPEFVVILAKDKRGLTYTYLFWNDKYAKEDEKEPLTEVGQVYYYEVNEEQLGGNFKSQFESVTSMADFYSLVDSALSGIAPTSIANGLRPNSYEAFKNETMTFEMVKNGKAVSVPYKQAWGHLSKGSYTYSEETEEYTRESETSGQHLAKVHPLFPPEEMKVIFGTNQSALSSILDPSPQERELGVISREELEKKLLEVLMYLRFYPEVNILIEGHTSVLGGNAINGPLSRNRAAAVQDYLTNLKVGDGDQQFKLPRERTATVGYGSKYASRGPDKDDDNYPGDRKIVIKYSVNNSADNTNDK